MKEYKNKINELDAHKKEIVKMVKAGCTQKEIAEKIRNLVCNYRILAQKTRHKARGNKRRKENKSKKMFKLYIQTT